MIRSFWALLACLVLAGCSSGGGSADMKTHASEAPGAKVSVVHFGAPW